jgi:hypothetical protein
MPPPTDNDKKFDPPKEMDGEAETVTEDVSSEIDIFTDGVEGPSVLVAQ